MNDPKKLFHNISYLQYPVMASSLIFYIPFIMSMFNQQPDWSDLNYVLILFGLGLSFSTLQDTTTTQNKFSEKIWKSPKKGRIMLILMTIFAAFLIIGGLIFMFLSKDDLTNSVAVGVMVLGIGYVGILKSGLEMYENHRIDKNPELKADFEETISADAAPLSKPS